MKPQKPAGGGRVVRVEAPDGTDPLLIAQAVVGRGWLIKAERVRGTKSSAFHSHNAMEQSLDAFMSLYERALTKMLGEVVDRLKQGAMRKTLTPKPLITAAQLQEIAERIRDFHSAIVLVGIGPEALLPADVERLIALKILPEETRSIIDDAYTYGALVAELRKLRSKAEQKKFTLDAFRESVMRAPIPLTDHEREAAALAKVQAATYVRGLGNRVADDFSTIAIEADRKLARKYREVIQDTVSEGVERRKTVREIASALGHKTGDWARDMRRIAATEKQRAMQEGFKQRLKEREGGDPLVAKIPTPDACDHCIRLHLTAGRGSKPRVFKLSALEQNGTNVGRKAADWRAVVGPVHPWCACELVHVPEGWRFNDDGDLVPERIRKGWRFERDLAKALTYVAPEHGVSVRVGDPEVVALIEEVLKRTPPVLFNARTGFTLVTTDFPSANSHLEEHDFAYWTGNEIRLMQTIKPEHVRTVLEHEIGHTLNVYLMHRFGSVAEVVKWHERLFNISKREGFITQYASTLPIENAAEVTRLYLYEREKLARRYPQQFRFVHRFYRDLFLVPENELDAHGWSRDADLDALDAASFYDRFQRAAFAHGASMASLPNGARIYTFGAQETPTLALLSGLHGEERAGPVALLRWLEDTAVGSLMPEGTSLWICPLFNCKGWDSFQRETDGINYNDVWMPGQAGRDESVREVERSLRAWKPTIFLDLHEDSTCEDGKPYVFGYRTDREFAPAMARTLGCKVVKWRGSDKSAIGASETFARFIGCTRTSTVETAQVRPLRERVDFHLSAITFARGELGLDD